MDIALSILRRTGLAAGAFLAAYAYFDNYLNTPVARRIAVGLALRGFEVVVPEADPD